jgi:hypothetical protein
MIVTHNVGAKKLKMNASYNEGKHVGNFYSIFIEKGCSKELSINFFHELAIVPYRS